MCSSASTCCAKGSTCRRCRWSRSSTRTRKASCAAETSLIQTIGRAARNVNAEVILYADTVTESMQRAIERDEPPARAADWRTTRSTASRRGRCRRRSRTRSRRRSRPTRWRRRRPAAGLAGGLRHARVHAGAARGDAGGGEEPGIRAGATAPRPDREARRANSRRSTATRPRRASSGARASRSASRPGRRKKGKWKKA